MKKFSTCAIVIIFLISELLKASYSDTSIFDREEEVKKVVENPSVVQQTISRNILKSAEVVTEKTSVLDIWTNTRNFPQEFVNKVGTFDDSSVDNFAKQYDVITSFFVLHKVEDKQAFLNSAYASLKPGGTLIMAVRPGGMPQSLSDKAIYSVLASHPEYELILKYFLANAPTCKEVEILLKNSSFVNCDVQVHQEVVSFASLEQFKAFKQAVFLGYKPIQEMPEVDRKILFELLINNVALDFDCKNDGPFSLPIHVMIVKATKPCV